MASFILLADSAVGQSLTGSETGYVGANASLALGGIAVNMSDSANLTVAGGVFATSTGVRISGTQSPMVAIHAGGSVVGAGFEGMNLSGAGDIRIYNFGTIQGGQSAIGCADITRMMTLRLVNGGQIIGNDATALYADGAGALTISNTGQIIGRQYGIYNQASEGQVLLENDGIIDGSLAAIALGGGNDIIHNRGVMSGDALLGGGNDLFDGRLGAQFQVFGSTGSDTILGGAGDEDFYGGDDGDVLKGGAGDDRMLGDNDADWLQGGEGQDLLYCGDGDDRADGGAGHDIVEGGLGLDSLSGGADDDLIDAMQDDDTARGDAGDDTVLGGDGNDLVSGGLGDDSVDGGSGIDTLFGGAGNDMLVAGGGTDKLDGGSGDDTLQGGAGSDRFIFNRSSGHDLVADFANNQDKLDLRAFDFASVAAVAATASDSALGLVIDLQSLGGGTITLAGFALANLDAADVLL